MTYTNFCIKIIKLIQIVSNILFSAYYRWHTLLLVAKEDRWPDKTIEESGILNVIIGSFPREQQTQPHFTFNPIK